ncbi:MAG: hypothetical protein ACLFV8_07915 [Alphaproteobacteria bacterium]
MARVPVRRTPRRFTQPPPPFDTSQVQSPFSQVLDTATALRDVVDQGLKDQGAEAGAKSVSVDEDGNINVDEPGFFGRLLPEYAAARENAAMATYLAETETKVQGKLAELRKKHPTDAKAFNAEAMAFARQMRDNDQHGFSAQVFQLAAREAQRQASGIQRRAERVELQKQEGALRASLGEKESRMMALARDGGTDTPEFQEISADYKAQLGILVNNPLFGFSQEEADVRVRNLQSRAKLEASSRDVMGVFQTKGELAAIERARTIADKLPGLTEPQREEWVRDQKVLINERQAAISKARGARRRRAKRIADDWKATLLAGNDDSAFRNDPGIFAGLEPDEEAALSEEIAAAKVTGQALKMIQGADPQTRAEIINSFPVEGPGAARNARIQSALQKEAGRVARTLDRDPAAQVAQSSPELVEDLNTALDEGDEDAFADAAASLIEEQQRLGAFNPRLLTEGQRRGLAASIVGEPDDENRVAGAVARIAQISETSGGHFPRIMAELAEEDDFPAALYGVGVIEGKPHAQFLLAKAALEDPKVLRENVGKLGTGAVDDLRDDLAGQEQELVASLAASGWPQTQIGKVTDSVEALASQYAIEQGKTGGAARKAFETMFGDYTFEGRYRVPAGRDPDAVRLGLEEIEERLQPDNFIVPHHSPLIRDEDAGRTYVSHLRSRGRWVTNPDETGLILVDGQGQPVMERPINPGEAPQVFDISFDQLEALGTGRGRREDIRRQATRPGPVRRVR